MVNFYPCSIGNFNFQIPLNAFTPLYCNIDVRLIICYKSLIAYLTKYETKCEKSSESLTKIIDRFVKEYENLGIKKAKSMLTRIFNAHRKQRDQS